MKLSNAKTMIDQQTGQCQFSNQQWKAICHFLSLSDREEFVCRLLCDGHTRDAIAAAMGVTSRAVRHHMEQIHRKLEVHNRVGVVLRLIQVRDTISGHVPSPMLHQTYEPILAS